MKNMVRIHWPWSKKKSPDSSFRKEKTATQDSLPRVAALAAAALRRTREIIGLTGSRLAGSQAARDAAKLLHDDLAKVCDSTASQTFLMNVGSYAGWIRWVPLLYIIALAFAWASLPMVSFILFLICAFYAINQFIFFRPVGEITHPKDEGINVHGVIEPSGQARRTIVFSGHHDSARLDTFSTGSKKEYMSTVFLPFACCMFLFAVVAVLTVGSLFGHSVVPWRSVPVLALLVIATVLWKMVLPLRTFFSEEASPGAGDNLVSSCIVIELARYFRARTRRGNPLVGTRLVFASFDGEEVGVRGSRAWFSRNKEQLIPPGTLGYHFNIDCPYRLQDVSFLSTDAHGTVHLSQQFATQCADVAQSIGYNVHSQKMPLLAGATDATEGARAGLSATTLMGVSWEDGRKSAPYHTPEDTPDAVEPEALEAVLAIAIKLVGTLDGLDGEDAMEASEDVTESSDEDAPLKFKRLTKR